MRYGVGTPTDSPTVITDTAVFRPGAHCLPYTQLVDDAFVGRRATLHLKRLAFYISMSLLMHRDAFGCVTMIPRTNAAQLRRSQATDGAGVSGYLGTNF
jgi:hypothetical protein